MCAEGGYHFTSELKLGSGGSSSPKKKKASCKAIPDATKQQLFQRPIHQGRGKMGGRVFILVGKSPSLTFSHTCDQYFTARHLLPGRQIRFRRAYSQRKMGAAQKNSMRHGSRRRAGHLSVARPLQPTSHADRRTGGGVSSKGLFPPRRPSLSLSLSI